MPANTYTAIDSTSSPRNITMRSLAEAMITPPDADRSRSTKASGPSSPSRRR